MDKLTFSVKKWFEIDEEIKTLQTRIKELNSFD